MAAQLEEVIVDANLVYAEQVLPDFADGPLELVARSDEFILQLRTGVTGDAICLRYRRV